MSTGKPQRSDRDTMGGLVKGLRILEAFDSAHVRMTITEAARRTQVSEAAARRCLLTLVQLGYLQTSGKHFWLDHGALKIGYAYAASTQLPRLIQPALDALSERSRESASLAVLHESAAVIAARSTARRTMRVGLGVGSRLPVYCSAAGRALIAHLPEAQARALLRGVAREALTPRTLTSLAELAEELRATRTRGYGVCDEEIELGVRSIAVPIFNRAGETIAAMTISTRAERRTLGELVHEFLPALLRNQQWARERFD